MKHPNKLKHTGKTNKLEQNLEEAGIYKINISDTERKHSYSAGITKSKIKSINTIVTFAIREQAWPSSQKRKKNIESII